MNPKEIETKNYPKRWPLVRLGEVANFKTGKLDSHYAEENGKFPFFTCAPTPSRINSYAFDCEAVLLAGNNANGIFHLNYYNDKFNVYQRTYVITQKDNRLSLKYLYFHLYLTLNLLRDISQGTATKFLTMRILNNLEIVLPSLYEQEKIAEFLWNIQNKIELNHQMNKTLEAIAKALFKHWFVDFEFPNEEGKPYKSSGGEMVFNEELGKEIPRGWDVGKLKSLINRNREKIETKEEWKDERIIDLSVMPQFSISLDSFQNGDAFDSNIYKMKEMDILFGSIRPYFGKAGFSPIRGVVTGTIFSYLPKDKDYYSYILFLTTSKEFIEFTVRYSKGTKMPIIGWKDFISYKIALPKDEKIISQFNFTMLGLINKILKNIQETHNLSKIRDSLLPKLMSGKIRVPVEVK